MRNRSVFRVFGANGAIGARPRGFTLVEAAVGVAAGGVASIAAMAIAGGARGDAHTVACQANLSVIGGAVTSYTTDNRGWLVGSPETSGRALLNDARAAEGGLALEVDGDATQAFDWAGPLAWTYIAPEEVRPERRDERFALLNGTKIPDYMAPGFEPNDVDLTPSIGPLGVFADPANVEVSLPYFGAVHPGGISGTAFQPQLASSYMVARGFLMLPPVSSSSSGPRWATDGFWGNAPGALYQANGAAGTLPGFDPATGVQPAYRPRIDRVGEPATKIQLADGTRYQISYLGSVDHDAGAQGSYGGAFGDQGAWDVAFTRTWPLGTNSEGEDMTAKSFRHGDGAGHEGNALFHDGHVELMSVDRARRPEFWLPRGTLVRRSAIWAPIRDEYEYESPLPDAPIGPALRTTRIW